MSDSLRQGLYAEEVKRDPEAAAGHYQAVLTQEASQKTIAATALFRLAEVRRQQGKVEVAIPLYQRLLTEFPKAEAEGKLARQHLTDLGGKIPQTGAAVVDEEETAELERLKKLLATRPELARDPGELLAAASHNRPQVVKLLLDSGSDPAAGTALLAAARQGHLEVVRLLLARSKQLAASQGPQALALATVGEHVEVVRALLAAKVDPNWQPAAFTPEPAPGAKPSEPSATPLIMAIRNNNRALINLLLDAKADVNRFTPGTRLTALQVAVALKDVGLARRLLELGSDPSAFSIPGYRPEPGVRSSFAARSVEDIRSGESSVLAPLDIALWNDDEECVKLLLEHGATSRDRRLLALMTVEGNIERVRLLLAHGADPNGPYLWWPFLEAKPEIARVFLEHGLKPDSSLLVSAIEKKKWEAARLLLEAGADPNGPGSQPFGKPLSAAIRDPDALPIVKLLLEKGAKIDETWEKQGSYPRSSVPLETRTFLFRLLTLPQLADSRDVRWVHQESSGTFVSILEEKSPSPHPKPLEHLLLVPKESIRWVGGTQGPTHLTLWRKGDDGQRVPTEFDLMADETFPALQWGDVIEASYDPKLKGPGWSSPPDDLPANLQWLLRQKLSFPVTVEIDGKATELQLRGDLLVFDPTRNEAPLCGARALLQLLWQAEFGCDPEIVITRAAWPAIRLPLLAAGEDFPLEAGDRLALSIPQPDPQQLRAFRRQHIVLKGAGYPFVRTFECVPSSSGKTRNPTLLQVLAEVMQVPGLAKAPENPADLPLWLLSAKRPAIVFPQRPDFSNLRIRRLLDDGTEQTLALDLTTAIDAASEDSPPEAARTADVPLQPGDIVELASRPLAEAPAGLSAKEESFFAKALDCRVQLTDPSGRVSLKTVSFHASQLLVTPAGLVPLPPRSGTASVTASAALGLPEWGTIEFTSQDGETGQGSADRVFLCEGDRIQVKSLIKPGTGTTSPAPPPTPPGARSGRSRPGQPPPPNEKR